MNCIENSIVINNIPLRFITNKYKNAYISVYVYRFFAELSLLDFSSLFNLNQETIELFKKAIVNRLRYLKHFYDKLIPEWDFRDTNYNKRILESQTSENVILVVEVYSEYKTLKEAYDFLYPNDPWREIGTVGHDKFKFDCNDEKSFTIFKQSIESTTISIINTYDSKASILVTFDWLKSFKNNFQKSVILFLLSDLIDTHTVLYSQTNNLLDISSVQNRLNLDYYVLPNRKEFLPFIDYFSERNEAFIKPYNRIFINRKPETFTLFKQQKFVTNYINDNTPYRGLLLYHGLGSGKSGASIATADGFREKEIVVMTPSSLRSNYISEIKSFGKISYRYQQNWCFTKINLKKLNEELLKEKGIPVELVKNYKDKKNTIVFTKKKVTGIWTINLKSEKPNFHEFTKQEQKEIKQTIDLLINYKYKFINYNGGRAVFKNIYTQLLTPEELKTVDELITTEDRKEVKKGDNIYNFFKQKIMNHIFSDSSKINNPFDNKVLVIDEVHNLISMMTKSNKLNAPYLYELIMRAKNLSLICLSGTPFINSPFELAILFNLLQGNHISYNFTVSTVEKESVQSVEEKLNKIIYLDRVSVSQGRKQNEYLVEVTKLPDYFIRKFPENDNNLKWKGKIMKSLTINPLQNKNEFENYLQLELKTFNLNVINEFELSNFTSFMPDILLPNMVNRQKEYPFSRIDSTQLDIAREQFFDMYVKNNELKEKISFYVRTMGLISFYSETSETVTKQFEYQTKNEVQTVSKFPSVTYHESDKQPLTIYQLLNYVKKREKELAEDENARKKMAQNRFNDEIQKSFRSNTRQICNFGFPPNVTRFNKNELNEKQLPKLSKDNLTPRNLLSNPNDKTIISLDELSLKYSLCVNRILEGTGLVLCYSQYRTVEGLEILGRILKTIGFQEYSESVSIREGDQCRIQLGRNITMTSKCTKIVKQKNKKFYQFENIKDDFKKVSFQIAKDWFSEEDLLKVQNQQITLNKFITKMKPHFDEEIIEILENEKIDTHLFNNRIVSPCCFSFFNNKSDKLLSKFTETVNRYGSKIQVLFITQSGAEGLNLKNIRDVHIIEPYWNRVRIEQVIGRARRVNSHLDLPPEQHNVTVYEYLSTFPLEITKDKLIDNNNSESVLEFINSDSNYSESQYLTKYSNISDFLLRLTKVVKKDNNKTTEEALFQISVEKKNLSNSFLGLVKNIAIDCKVNLKDNDRAEQLQKDYKEITCFDSKEAQQKHRAILSRDEYNYNKGVPEDELSEAIVRSMNVYLVDTVDFFSLPVKYLALQNRIKNYYHKDFEFWSKKPYFGKNLMMIKANNQIVSFYQYMGLDPLYQSFTNPLLRKTDKITSSVVLGSYEEKTKQEIFNGKNIKLNLGDKINQQKAYSIYLFKLQQMINQIITEKQLEFTKENVLNSTKFNEMLSVMRKELKSKFVIQFKLNNQLIKRSFSDFSSPSFIESLTKEIIQNKLTLESYLLFLYNQEQNK